MYDTDSIHYDTQPEDGGSSDADNRKAVFEATCRLTESCLLLAIDANTYLVCFACGMYPIYSGKALKNLFTYPSVCSLKSL